MRDARTVTTDTLTVLAMTDGVRALAELSSASKLIVATRSDHEIQLYEPDLVVGAIHDVLVQAKARRSRHASR